MKTARIIAALLIVLTLALGAAQADTLTISGTVEAGVKIPVYAPIGGTVEDVAVEAGAWVEAGDPLFTYRTEKTYASLDGTVAGIFVQPGDDAETMTERFGADLYIEGSEKYTISANTNKAYDSEKMKFIHTGEKVYLVSRKDAKRTGAGIVTAVDGTSYTVQVEEGSFIPGESVAVYRDAEHSDKQRLGRGTLSRIAPTAVNATGAVVNVAVKDGDQVKRGDLLLETLTGTFDAYEMTGTAVTAGETGIVTSVTAEAGAVLTKGDIALQIAPLSGMRVEAIISADDRNTLHAGDKVTIALEADSSRAYEGTVRSISGIPEEDTTEVSYKVLIDFTPDDYVAFGMKVEVTAGTKTAGTDAGEGT